MKWKTQVSWFSLLCALIVVDQLSDKKGVPMNDEKIQAVPATKSGQPSRRSVNRWKRRSSILLMLLGACALILYLVRAGLAKEYAGLGAALCMIALGGFLIWHAVHLFTEEDTFDEQQLLARDSSRQSNPTDEQSD